MASTQFPLLENDPSPPPPTEISLLAQLCLLGDTSDPVVNEKFLSGLKAFEATGHSLLELWPVLLSAVESARPGIIKLLLSLGLEMNEMYIKQAVKTRSKEVFQAFIDGGWNVNAQYGYFQPPVLACFVDDPDFAQWLLARGADPNARCYLDLTPLSFAVRHARPENVEILLDRGGIEKGQLVHHAVERREGAIQVLQMLVSRGASLNKIQYSDDLDSWNHEHFKGLGTPLHRAVELGNVEVAEYLLREGVDTAIRDTKGRTPLDIARTAKDTDLIDLLTRATTD